MNSAPEPATLSSLATNPAGRSRRVPVVRARHARRAFLVSLLLAAPGLAAGALAAGSDATPRFAAAPAYSVADLGTLPGGTQSFAYGINSDGVVVGQSDTTGGNYHGFLFFGSTMSELIPAGANGSAAAINSAQQVVGWDDVSGSSDTYHAFRLSEPATSDLGTLPGGSNSSAAAINDAGQIAGWGDVASGVVHAFLHLGGGTLAAGDDLGTLPGGNNSYAYGLNASGQVAGAADTSSGSAHAFVDSGGVMSDLGTLPGGANSSAAAINASGQVTGWSESTGGVLHAFLHSGSGRLASGDDLGTLPGGSFSVAYAINTSGQVVGQADTSNGAAHAFLYSGGMMSDLNDLLPAGSGWELLEARAINDSGQIVGNGTINGQSHAFLLTPQTAPTATPTATNTSAPPTNTPMPPTSTPTVTASLVISPSSGAPSQSVSASGNNFGRVETVRVLWDGATPVSTATTDGSGAFAARFAVPKAPSGRHAVRATGQSSGRSARAYFTVKPTTFLAHPSGTQRSPNSLAGFGYGMTETVKAYWYPGALFLGSARTNAQGSFSGTSAISFTVPLSPAGTYSIVGVGQTSGGTATSKFVLVPALSINPTSGARGSSATVTGTGYKAGDSVAVRWDCSTATCSSTLALGTKAADANGDLSLGVTIPTTATVATHTLGGKGVSGAFATTAYTVTG